MPKTFDVGARRERFIGKMVDSGRYATADAVVKEALDRLESTELAGQTELAELRSSLEDARRSPTARSMDVVFDELASELRDDQIGRGRNAEGRYPA